MIRRALGRHPDAAANHDVRSLDFPAPSDLSVVTKKWRRYGTVLDQGQVGSCTGNAAAQALNHLPFHVTGTSCFHEPDAVAFYTLATELDPYPGTYPEQDTGSDGLSVAKAVQQSGDISTYLHAFGLNHVLSALMSGPLICGTDWHEDMFDPDSSGVVHPTGAVVGGHEYVLDGVYTTSRMLRFLNSWSSSWGANGRFYMSFDDFSTLLNEGGDAVLFRR